MGLFVGPKYNIYFYNGLSSDFLILYIYVYYIILPVNIYCIMQILNINLFLFILILILAFLYNFSYIKTINSPNVLLYISGQINIIYILLLIY